jgi:hypothetical protein
MHGLPAELQSMVGKELGGSVEDMVALYQACRFWRSEVYKCFMGSLREQPPGEAQAAFESAAAVGFVREGVDGGLMG